MARPDDACAAPGRADGCYLNVVADEAVVGLGSSTLAAPGFLVAWAAVGLAVALHLAGRGHDRRTMVTIGLGLGPLMVLYATEAVRRHEEGVAPLVLEPAADLGGDLDVVVLVHDDASSVVSVVPTLCAIRTDLRLLTVVSCVDYEWLAGDLDNDEVDRSTATVELAAVRLALPGIGREIHPGLPTEVARRLASRPHRTLVLHAHGHDGEASGGR